MLEVLALAFLFSSVAVAGPFEEECSPWNASGIPVATSFSQYGLQDLTSSTIDSGIVTKWTLF